METKEPQRFTEEKEKELKLIEIPRTISDERFERNREKADGEGLEHCPCCGRAIHNPTYFFNSAFGGMAWVLDLNVGKNSPMVMSIREKNLMIYPNSIILLYNHLPQSN